ncbi:wyosine [tRNA(Phe)-imidazoG37] synthetase (radical SAM superfamily) [Silvimonas terrae]|uniref:Wyosine [tRNA(Phe)-imidazoG37] synthetase (Radical SAM superfamily) n=1 Tax=Silvimonas terrae TaxID=300266 RepID=A0A840RAA2_9NEIS|nr:radical SAM protein [Silvimonas terrae]MBB5190285.1 wyosine [tRNA(Phe)-imidazoG37] synthetase (radical SAM superfamily) [Silvimonas terrae]
MADGFPVRVLRVSDHSRDSAGFTYVYPVVSRRAGGVSIGINLNPNNACNWRCLYCQVPDLKRGGPPPIDLLQLEDQLATMLHQIVDGDFMQERVPPELRRLNDVAFSGNGEPTMSPEFGHALAIVERQLQAFGLLGQIKIVLITNGSQLYKPEVQDVVAQMGRINGELWFKVDRAPQDGFAQVNQVQLNRAAVVRHLIAASARCATWLQTCMFELDGALPDAEEVAAYVAFAGELKAQAPGLKGVLLYGLARPSMQPEAPRLRAAPVEWMKTLAEQISAQGLEVKLSI